MTIKKDTTNMNKWRLPTSPELASIHRGIVAEKFLDIDALVWTSWLYKDRADTVWVYHMGHGLSTDASIAQDCCVLPVRGTHETNVLEVAPRSPGLMDWEDAQKYVDELEKEQDGTILLELNGISYFLKGEAICQH